MAGYKIGSVIEFDDRLPYCQVLRGVIVEIKPPLGDYPAYATVRRSDGRMSYSVALVPSFSRLISEEASP